MIVCRYKKLQRYQDLLPGLQEALECVERLRKEHFPSGRYEFKSGYLTVQTGETKPFAEDAFEAHRKMTDVHYMIKGKEAAFYLPLDAAASTGDYDEEDDIAFYRAKEGWSRLLIGEGMSYVAFPEDAHMPVRHPGECSGSYTKIVIKLKAL